MYADDIVLQQSDQSTKEINAIIHALLLKATNWLHENQGTFNLDKTAGVLFCQQPLPRMKVSKLMKTGQTILQLILWSTLKRLDGNFSCKHDTSLLQK